VSECFYDNTDETDERNHLEETPKITTKQT